jgi:hypothetical protein
MDIEIITTTNNNNNNNTETVVMNEMEEPTILEHSNRKILSKSDIDNLIDKVLTNIMDYLTEHTEFEHMRDEIINQRMRAITKEKYSEHIEHTIDNFTKFLNQDESILEYIEENGKLIYGTGDDIDEFIYEKVYIETPYVYDIAQGWLSWDNYRCQFSNNNNFLGQEVLINDIIKYVFEQYGNGFEYLEDNIDNTPDNTPDNTLDNNNDDKQENEPEQKNNEDCVIC